ncbi:DNA primase [Streptomyces griseofuscus]|uniref:DNA primase n=1 Tax=Streptomyces griseofuscus TaxID=146922 RepID=UPI00118AE24D|nr:hypothetical protein SRO_1395 [Streptomyces rochei]
MNRTALGLAIGAGYFLGRTRKLKMAIAVGSLVAGKKLNLGPGALVDLARQQLRDNPQFKEIGEQLRTDLRGVGKAASGAMVERQMSTLADRLHDRTAQVRGELPGADESDDESDEAPEAGRDDEDRAADRDDEPDGGGSTPKPRAQKPAAKKTAARRTGTTEKTGPAKRKTAAKKTGAQRQTAAKKPAGSRGGGSAKGGDER